MREKSALLDFTAISRPLNLVGTCVVRGPNTMLGGFPINYHCGFAERFLSESIIFFLFLFNASLLFHR
jgi:hypothetical protein